jgi:hypothetical protein
MNGKVKILFFCMIFVAGPAFCQKSTGSGHTYDALFYYKKAGLNISKQSSFVAKVAAADKLAGSFSFSGTKQILPIIAADFYTSNFGFFCKKELQFEKITKLPFKFRLGSVEQCNRLEGKTVAVTQ